MEDKYGKSVLEKIEDLRMALKYYIDKSNKLETELETYKTMYENRVNEYLKQAKE